MLSILLPTATETDLLRACLWSGAAASDAWSRWQQAIGGAERASAPRDSATKGLLPLLHRALRRNAVSVAAPLRAALGVAALAEERRYQAYRHISVRALDTLAAASIRCLVLKGAALAEMVYPEPALRHSHDIDLLVGAADLDRATAALRRAGYVPSPVRRRGFDARRLVDPSGLPIELHDRLFRLPFYAPPLADVWARARSCQIAERGASTLSAADHLAHVCGQAACGGGGRDSLRWVCDAWYLIEQRAELDWDVLLRVVADGRLSLPLTTLFEYLATELGAEIPAPVRERLADQAAGADRAARDIALVGARAGARGTLRNLWRAAPAAAERVELLRWLLVPSPTSLRRGTTLRYPRLWAFEYLGRPARYLIGAIRRRRS